MEEVHYKCGQCGDEWDAPSYQYNQWWGDLSEQLGGFLPWGEVQRWLNHNTKYDERTCKVITMHMTLVENRCHYCSAELPERGVVTCPSCSSLNYNFVRGDATIWS